MTRDEARVGARVTWATAPDDLPPDAGTVVEVNAQFVAVKWDDGSVHHVSELRLLPDEAQP